MAAGGAAGGVSLGGAGAGGAGSAQPPGGVDWEPWPEVPSVAPSVCQTAYFYGGDAHSPPVTPDVSTRAYDATKGVLTTHYPASSSVPATNFYSFFNAQGRPLGSCNNANEDVFYCEEWVRDAHGNVTSTQSLDIPTRNVDQLNATNVGVQARGNLLQAFNVTYDGAGVLLSGDYRNGLPNVRRTFSEDDEHRCTDILWETLPNLNDLTVSASEREHWSWQGDRLVSRLVTSATDATDVRSEVTFTYDENGDLSATVVDGFPKVPGGTVRAKRDGIADYVLRTVALPDGSRWVESLIFRPEFTNATVTRNGQPTIVQRRRFYLSPGCRSVQLPRRTSHRCEFQPQTPEFELHWDDPYTTPIPAW